MLMVPVIQGLGFRFRVQFKSRLLRCGSALFVLLFGISRSDDGVCELTCIPILPGLLVFIGITSTVLIMIITTNF